MPNRMLELISPDYWLSQINWFGVAVLVVAGGVMAWQALRRRFRP